MCVAIYKYRGQSISKETLRNCFNRNPDGAGFMYPKDKKVVVVKGFFKFKDFWEAWKEHVLAEGAPAANCGIGIHFRIGTSGLKDEVNCHPHVVSEDFAFIHNGVMSSYVRSEDGKKHLSDTAHFMAETIRPLYEQMGPNMLRTQAVFNLIQDHIGTYNKMVFMNGEHAWMMGGGYEEEGSWFSNLIWKPVVYTPPAVTDYGRPASTPDYSGRRKFWEDGAFQKGCYVDSKWMFWKDYRVKFPANGPFEDEYEHYYIKGFHTEFFRNGRGEKWDPIDRKWKKSENPTGDLCQLPVPPSVGSETDEQGNVLSASTNDTVPVEEIGSEVQLLEEVCVHCKDPLDDLEKGSGEGYCIDCLINVGTRGGD